MVPGSLGCIEGSEPGLVFGRNTSAMYLFECFCQFAEIAFDAHLPNLLLHPCR